MSTVPAAAYLDTVNAIMSRAYPTSYQWQTPDGARQLVAHLRHTQKELRLVKQEVRVVMKSIRDAYTNNRAKMRAIPIFLTRGAAKQERANRREKSRQNELADLQPYQYVLAAIDHALLQLDSARMNIERDTQRRR